MRDKLTHKKLLPVIIALLVVMTVGTGLALNRQKPDEKKPAANTSQNEQKPADDSTKIAKAETSSVSYDGQEGKTALELLKQNAEVVTKDSAYGPYVDSINNVQGGTDGKYWAFYVNGQMAQVGADAYQTKTGDKIEWKFE
jgi:uncharacterized protein YxeA